MGCFHVTAIQGAMNGATRSLLDVTKILGVNCQAED